MTIQEFYDWAIRNSVVEYDLRTENWFDLRDIDIEINNETKEVIV